MLSVNDRSIRVAVAGANGRMGRQIIQTVMQSKQVTLGAALSYSLFGLNPIDAGELVGAGTSGITIVNNLEIIKNNFDILIDFTHPDATIKHLDFCCQHRKGIVIGTTGFSNTQKEIISAAAHKTCVVFSSNFSTVVNLMLKLLEKTTQVIGKETDIEIIDMHHHHKADVPSGTALAMGEVIAKVLEYDLSTQGVTCNYKSSSDDHQKRGICFSTVRAGDILGEHTVMFVKFGERLEITHKVSNRAIFAKGAIRAAVWLYEQKNGLYNMSNVLNLDKL